VGVGSIRLSEELSHFRGVRYHTGTVQFRAPLCVVLLSFLCLSFHELGHVVAGLCFGGEVREFVLLSLVPHVSLSGAFSAVQESWIAVAGSLCEIVFFVAAVAVGWRLAVEVTGVFACIELVGWTAAAVAWPHGPRDNDAYDFLAQSGVSGWWVVAVCVSLASIVWVLWRMRTNAPNSESCLGRNGTIPVIDRAEVISHVEISESLTLRSCGRFAVARAGAGAGGQSERPE